MHSVYNSKNKINYFEEKVLGKFISAIQNFCSLYLTDGFDIITFKDSSEMPYGNEYSSQIITFNDAKFLVFMALSNQNLTNIGFDFSTNKIPDELFEAILSHILEDAQNKFSLSGPLAIDKELLKQFLKLNGSYKFHIQLVTNCIDCFFVSIAE